MRADIDYEAHLVPGFRLDRYELLCPIGRGGMASVWVGRLLGKHGFEKLVAIKMILTTYARDAQFQRMFLDEARIASGIHHPNVAEVLDLGDQRGIIYIVMEWIEGDALSKLARAVSERGDAFPAPIALRIAADVCAGLHAAHELRDRAGAPLGLVHRDVSPQNVLLSDRGIAKVIDFGIAKATGRASTDTETGSVMGKVKFMAPEQAVAPRTVDRRVDIWAVGAILYFLASGRCPYEDETDIAMLAKLASSKPPPELPDEHPGMLRDLTRRALEYHRDRRFGTAYEFREAIEEAMVANRSLATHADVAEFSAKYLGDRTEARHKSIALALSAAEERSRVFGLLKPQDDLSTRRSIPRAAGGPIPSSSPTLADLAVPRASGEGAQDGGSGGYAAAQFRGRKHLGTVAVLGLAAAIPIALISWVTHPASTAFKSASPLAPVGEAATPAPPATSRVSASGTPAGSDFAAQAPSASSSSLAARRLPARPVTTHDGRHAATAPKPAPGDYGF
jgi:serine/threonine-protein kinase